MAPKISRSGCPTACLQVHRAPTTTDAYASRYFARLAAFAAARSVVPDADLRVTHLPWAHAYLFQFDGVTVDEKLLRAIEFQFARYFNEGFVAESGRMAWAPAASGQFGPLTTELVSAANDPAFDIIHLGGVPILAQVRLCTRRNADRGPWACTGIVPRSTRGVAMQAHELVPVQQRCPLACALEAHLGGFAVVYPSRTGPANLALRDVRRLTHVALERQALMAQLGLRSIGAINSVVAVRAADHRVCTLGTLRSAPYVRRRRARSAPSSTCARRGT
jgi:hypothetical protein